MQMENFLWEGQLASYPIAKGSTALPVRAWLPSKGFRLTNPLQRMDNRRFTPEKTDPATRRFATVAPCPLWQ